LTHEFHGEFTRGFHWAADGDSWCPRGSMVSQAASSHENEGTARNTARDTLEKSQVMTKNLYITSRIAV